MDNVYISVPHGTGPVEPIYLNKNYIKSRWSCAVLIINPIIIILNIKNY